MTDASTIRDWKQFCIELPRVLEAIPFAPTEMRFEVLARILNAPESPFEVGIAAGGVYQVATRPGFHELVRREGGTAALADLDDGLAVLEGWLESLDERPEILDEVVAKLPC